MEQGLPVHTDTAQREKRRFARVPARNLVAFAYLTPELRPEVRKAPTEGLGRTLDVCAGGTRLETNRELKIGDRLQLDIALGSMIVKAEATVIHVEVGDDAMTQAGLVFDRIPAPDRETLTALGY